MKKIIQLAIVGLFSLTAMSTYAKADEKPDAPAKEAPKPQKVTLTGTLTKDGEKIKFKCETGKKYTVVKKQHDNVKEYIGKKVKILCKTKSKTAKNGKPFHMIVWVKEVSPVE